jgi:hypothetical protein
MTLLELPCKGETRSLGEILAKEDQRNLYLVLMSLAVGWRLNSLAIISILTYRNFLVRDYWCVNVG